MVLYRDLQCEVRWPAKKTCKIHTKQPRAAERMAAPLATMPLTWDIEMEKTNSSTKKARRSTRRKTKAMERRGEDMPLLRASSVKPATQQRYREHWCNLQDWCKKNQKRMKTAEEFDACLEKYLEELYLGGEDLSVGNYGGCSQLPSARPPGSSESTSDSSVTQGVADSMPPSVSNAHSLRGHLPFSSGGFVEGEDRDLPGSIAELLLLPSAHRVRENQSLRHCGPGGERRRSISLVECLASPSGDGSSIKDSTVGRGTSDGPPLSTVPGRGNGETPQPEKKTKRRKSIQGDISRSEPVHEHSLEATAADPPARSSPISTSTWRSFPRHSMQTSDLTGGPSSWKVDGVEKREKRREGQPSCTTVRKPKQKHTEKMPRRKKSIGRDILSRQ